MDGKDILIFATGVVIGGAVSAFVTNKIVSKKAEKRIEIEVASVKEEFKHRKPLDISKIKSDIEKKVVKEQAAKANLNKPALQAYSSLAKQYESKPEEPAKNNDSFGVEQITVNEYGEMAEAGYESKECIWYADNILADDNYEQINNPAFDDLAKQFSDSGEDELYFRDHDDEIDYAIYRSDKTYAEDIADDNARKKLPNKRDEG